MGFRSVAAVRDGGGVRGGVARGRGRSRCRRGRRLRGLRRGGRWKMA